MAEARVGPSGRASAVELLGDLAERLEENGADADLAQVQEDLAALHEAQGDLDAANQALRQALRIRRRHTNTVYARCRLAERARLLHQRRTLEAEALARRNQELARAAAQLAMENEAHVRAIRQLGHDLRNPLTVIVGSLDLLDPDDRPDLQSSMQIHARRMWDLTTEAMTRSGPESQFQPRWFDLSALICTVVEAYAPRASQKGVLLQERTCGGAPSSRTRVGSVESSTTWSAMP